MFAERRQSEEEEREEGEEEEKVEWEEQDRVRRGRAAEDAKKRMLSLLSLLFRER